jgi:hypothetical protein
VDKRILAALNAPGMFKGNISNGANIGLSTEEMVQLWNQAHPEDPIELESTSGPQPSQP